MRLSASQVQTFSDCPRKWAWRYVAGVEEPPSPAAELGRAVHAELEKYLRGGDIDFTTEVGYIAVAGIEHLPKPGTVGLRIEEEFHFEGPSGHSYLGYKDLEVPGVVHLAQLGVVYDHKTTSDLKWQKTEDDLKRDIQATLYAVDYFRNHPDESEVELRWVYYQTKNTKKSAITRLRVHQTDAWNRFLEIEQIAETMSTAAEKQPLDLPPNINHCSAYGGCPHQGRCNLSPFEKMRSHVEQNKLLLALQAKKNGAADAPAVAALAAAAGGAAVPAAPLATAPPNALLARLRAGGAPAAAVQEAPVAPAPVAEAPAPVAAAAVPVAAAPAPVAAPTTGNKLLARLQSSGAAAAGPAAGPAINPPEHQPPPAPPAAAPTRDEVLAAIASGQTLTGPVAHAAQRLIAEAAQAVPPATAPSPAAAAPAPAAAAPAPAAAAPAAAADATRGRGRPKKATVPATGLAVKIETLYLDCGPVGAPVADATHFIVLAKKRVAAEGLADYRFAEFGHGPGMLAVAAAAELDALEGVLPALRLDTTTPEGSIIAVEFVARAGLVVR
jgi:CRISPR/Cas system-associated exonuclease Cas4 (RecB family)